MKRGILFVLLIIVFLATACEKANSKKEEENHSSMDYITIQKEQFKLVQSTNLHDMQYHVNDDDFHTEATENTRVMNYTLQERLVFEVRIMSDENRSLSELKSILRTQNESELYTLLKKEQPKEEVKGIKNKMAMKAISKISSTCKKEGDIVWNFTKFLVDRNGNVVKRYDPTFNPAEMENDIKILL